MRCLGRSYRVDLRAREKRDWPVEGVAPIRQAADGELAAQEGCRQLLLVARAEVPMVESMLLGSTGVVAEWRSLDCRHVSGCRGRSMYQAGDGAGSMTCMAYGSDGILMVWTSTGPRPSAPGWIAWKSMPGVVTHMPAPSWCTLPAPWISCGICQSRPSGTARQPRCGGCANRAGTRCGESPMPTIRRLRSG